MKELVLVNQLTEAGYTVSFELNGVRIRGNKKNRLYKTVQDAHQQLVGTQKNDIKPYLIRF